MKHIIFTRADQIIDSWYILMISWHKECLRRHGKEMQECMLEQLYAMAKFWV